MAYTPKPPRRVTLAAKVEPRIKTWLKKQFPESVSHGVNHILAEYMTKHTKGGRYKLVPVEPTVKELYEEFSQWCSENRGMDFDCRLHTHGGRIEDGGYISHEKTRHAFVAYRAGRKMAKHTKGANHVNDD